MKLFNRRGHRAAAQGAPNVDRRWEYLSPHSELVAGLAAEAVATARLGQPDPIHGTSVPEVFNRSNATFAQLVQNARKGAVDDCADDVAFLVDHAAEFVTLRTGDTENAELPGPETERIARLRAEVGGRLGRLSAREEQHRAELAELKHAADATTALLKAVWQSAHPHPDHLDHFVIPMFEMPSDADDIGQRAVQSAFSGVAN